jgi:hypothetical protein
MRFSARPFVPALALVCIASAAPRAHAFGGSARELERQGTFAVTNKADFGFEQQLNSPTHTTFSLKPALDYFVIDRLSVGGAVGLQFFGPPSPQPNSTVFTIEPEVGYELALSDTWSFWPQASLPMTFPSGANASLALVLFVPFLVHPAEHFFFGIGPGLSQGLTSNPSTLITGGFRIGGYFDH